MRHLVFGRVIRGLTGSLLVVASAVPSLASVPAAPAIRSGRELADRRPNVLLIVTDDQRAHGTISAMPFVRRILGKGGRRYPNFFTTTPLCCPSRSSIFSGRFAHNTGVLTNGDAEAVLAFDYRATIQGYLGQAGYETAMVGKYFNTWRLVNDPPGFDRWALFGGGYRDAYFNIDGSGARLPGYTTDVLTGLSKDIVEGFEADDDAPWFLYVAPNAPHSPFEPEYRYDDAPVGRWRPPPSFGEEDLSDKPPWVQWRTFSKTQARTLRAGQLRTLMSVDEMVGSIFRTLKSLGEAENTLAIFTSDNGYLWGEHSIGEEKRFPYGDAVRVPFLMRWPGHVPPGTTDARIAGNVDILPTILEATGVSPKLLYPIDGRSLLQPGPGRRRMLLEYWRSPDAEGIPSWASMLTPALQYIEWFDDRGEVIFREYYNLRIDPGAMTNLLADGNASNDPSFAALASTLDRMRMCSGKNCP